MTLKLNGLKLVKELRKNIQLFLNLKQDLANNSQIYK